MTKDKHIHEGEVEFIVCCKDEDSMDYMDNTWLDQEQIDKFKLRENDRVLYKIDKNGYAKVIGKVHIKKTIEKLA